MNQDKLTAYNTAPSGLDPDYYVLQSWAYDAEGHTVSYTWEGHDMTGVRHSSRYDARGRLVEKTIDRDPQGSIDETLTLTYNCP